MEERVIENFFIHSEVKTTAISDYWCPFVLIIGTHNKFGNISSSFQSNVLWNKAKLFTLSLLKYCVQKHLCFLNSQNLYGLILFLDDFISLYVKEVLKEMLGIFSQISFLISRLILSFLLLPLSPLPLYCPLSLRWPCFFSFGKDPDDERDWRKKEKGEA